MPDIEEEVDYEGDIAELGIIDILPIMERGNLVLEQSKDMVIKNALVVAGKYDYVDRLVIKEGVLFEKREGHNPTNNFRCIYIVYLHNIYYVYDICILYVVSTYIMYIIK